MRTTGLAVGDACTLPVHGAIVDGTLTVRRTKTGVGVMMPVAPQVMTALAAFPPTSARYYFWSGKGMRRSISGLWQDRLKTIFRKAGISDGHSHRFRDTFAVELLQAGTSMEDVSMLLGHHSIKTTERYYMPWCPRRRERLQRVVQAAWSKDPLLQEMEAGRWGTVPR